MIFAFDDSIYDLGIIYGGGLLTFTFIDDKKHQIIMDYHQTACGAHQMCVTNYQNDQWHGTQLYWWSIEEGGHQRSIRNYQNGKKHGTQYGWWSARCGGHQMYIENYQNGEYHGVQHHWDEDGSYYTESC
jgi:antitoxin component YwqK of YwqJK toxin-antitoxin module